MIAFVGNVAGLKLKRPGFDGSTDGNGLNRLGWFYAGRWKTAKSNRKAYPCMVEKETSVESSGTGVESGSGTVSGETSRPRKESKIGGKKSLLRPDGTPYAPWMRVAEGSELRRKPKSDVKGKLANDPQEGELSGLGLGYKMLGDELELRWSTGKEEGNSGFVISRRAGQTDIWEQVADYTSAPAQLMSKGPEGGGYSYIVEDVSPGTWIYRVSDVDSAGRRSDLSQCLVEIQSSDDRKKQTFALVGLVVLGICMVLGGLLLDPLRGVN